MPTDGEGQPLFLLSDEPVDTYLSDRLDMETYRNVIVGAVLGTLGPFTIGVYGRWGEGKTSLLRSAESRLKAKIDDATKTPSTRKGEPEFPYVVPVWFNPWQYESEAHPLIPLVAEIERAVTDALADEKSIAARYGPKTVQWLKGIGYAGLSMLRAVSLKGTLAAGVPLAAEGGVEVELSGDKLVEGLEKAWEQSRKERPSRWQSLVDQSTYLTIFDRLRALYDELDLARPGQEKRIPRIAVFIDDLDRCRPDKAFELIEAVKLVLGQKGFIFILALDKGIVDAYVDGLWRDRLKDRTGAEAARYLDKIIQLPLHLRSHDRAFTPFVQSAIDKMKAAKVDKDTVAVFESVKDHLGRTTDHSPRSLVRRINTLLVDQRLRPPTHADDPECVRSLTPAQFLGLCLVQRTLLDYLDRSLILEMAADEDFCSTMAGFCESEEAPKDSPGADAVAAMYLYLDNLRTAKAESAKLGERALGADDPRDHDPDGQVRRRRWLAKLYVSPACRYVLSTDHGARWLSNSVLRRLVTHFDPQLPTPLASNPSPEKRAPSNDRPNASPEVQRSAQPIAETPTLREQIALIERTLRESPKLLESADLTPELLGNVVLLDLFGEPITDEGLEWLVHPDRGLKALRTLHLTSTKVTDAGVSSLSSSETGLKSLKMLHLGHTAVTDVGVSALCSVKTGLRSLIGLSLYGAKVTDAGVSALCSAETGLKSLTWLSLGGTGVTDAGVSALCSAETGLKCLTRLQLHDTGVTDKGVSSLSSAGTGLKSLTSLDLYNTKVTDAGLSAMLGPQTGLKSLTTLHLYGTKVTDAGLASLSSAEMGLKSLKTLNLRNTKVTGAGVAALKERWPNLRILR